MLYEIVSEIIITFVMVAMAHVLGHKLVKLVEAPIREDEHFLIAPPRRKANCVKHARKLRGQFARRNTYADCQSETLIVLPSISTDWIAGCTVAGVIMVLLTLNHVDGAAQLFVAPQDHDIFYDYMIALMGFSVIAMGIGAWVAEIVIPNAAMARATMMAETRLKKHRTARFAQALSLNEVAEVASWAVREERMERRIRRDNGNRKARNRKQLETEILQFPSNSMGFAANSK